MSKLRTVNIFGICSVFCIMLVLGFTSQAFVTAQQEEQSSNIVVDSVPQSSVSHALLEKVKTSWPWYVTRASGLVAGCILFVLMISGMGFITGSTYRFLEPITAWATHKALGIALVISIILHVGALYFDEFVHFGIKSLLVPFASDFRPTVLFGHDVGSLYIALGIFALYIFIAIVFTSLIWIHKKPRTWKAIHILSYIAMVFVFVHALYLGTDLVEGVLRYIWIGMGVCISLLFLLRLWRAKTV